MTTKPETQSEKDKEAVQKMIGAKSAMEAALRRIAELENALMVAKIRIEAMGKAHGDALAFRVYVEGNPKFVSAKEHTRKAINEIDDAL